MSLKILDALKRREPPKVDTSAAEQAVAQAKAQAAAQVKAAEARVAKAEASAKAATEAAAKAARALEDAALDTQLSNALATAKVLNPAHATALLRSRFALVDGKVVSKDDPTKGVTDVVTGFLADEGRYMLPAAVPGGGAGAPSTPSAPAAAKPHDLTSNAGQTAFARQLTHDALTARTPAPGNGAAGKPQTGQA